MKNIPSVDTLIKPFLPYIKRYGFMYVHFKNGTGLMAKDWSEVVFELWNGVEKDYNKKVKEWCEFNAVTQKSES